MYKYILANWRMNGKRQFGEINLYKMKKDKGRYRSEKVPVILFDDERIELLGICNASDMRNIFQEG